MLDDNSLLDVGFRGLSYTWFNNRASIDAFFERLDSVVANQQGLNVYRDAIVENLPIIVGDHGWFSNLEYFKLAGKHSHFKNLKLNGY